MKILAHLANNISGRTGIYTKRQCADIAVRVGKELVDMKNAGVKMDDKLCMYVTKKHIPRADFRIFWGDKDIIERGDPFMKILISPENKNRIMAYYSTDPNALLLTDELLNRGDEIEGYTHELQHYIYNNYTPFRKLLKKISKSSGENYDPHEHEISTKERCTKPDFESTLRRLLIAKRPEVKSIKELVEHFASNTNITSRKRLDAYIASICRYFESSNSIVNIINMIAQISYLKNEINSYTAQDIVTKYHNKNKKGFKIEVQLYKETIKVLKKEILRNIRLKHPKTAQQNNTRDLPSPVFE